MGDISFFRKLGFKIALPFILVGLLPLFTGIFFLFKYTEGLIRDDACNNLGLLAKNTEEEVCRFMTNIIINVQQAMPEGGQLFISSRNGKGNVAMEFKDTGCGIPEKYKDRIFEPFFTTKMDWKGTGLGLSICYDIIKNHSGSIVVDSQLGKGAVFKII
ncbi:MAG: hypothetical protein HW406_1691 [Candidatus Brocadiaceae bacterium]|nr:hypothetical protein [Candidatus Brocadiaceae bacterium]